MMVKKHIVILLVFFSVGLFGQDNKGTGKNVIPENWYNLDIETDGVAGVSVDRAYELLKKKKSTRVIVAVLDNGVQTDHEDLIGKIWLNEDEIPGNNRDDDNNGYEDDMHGWNFIGGKSGDVKEDTHELTRVYLSLKEKYGVLKRREVRKENWEEFDYWEKIKENFEKTLGEAEEKYNFYSNLKFSVGLYDSLFCIMLGVDSLTKEDLERVEVKDTNFKQGKSILQFVLNATKNELTIKEIIHDLKEMEKYYKDQLDFTYNVRFNPREIVGDNYSDINERYYGNNHVAGPSPEHGTHVAGIIAANRDNGLGIRGIADNVQVMALRVVPDGDERDKDIANAIRYAVDNGARVINMSFGKSYSPGKNAVDKAVQYADSAGVLMIHAAGNEHKNRDVSHRYPLKNYADSTGKANNWIEVGATAWKEDKTFVGDFSNYGKNTVDIFAPGVAVYSTVNNNTYKSLDGTSFAAPVVSGVAALLMSYFPHLTATQVKEILLQSARKIEGLQVYRPGGEDILVDFSELSTTGGVVNAYLAVQMAKKIKP